MKIEKTTVEVEKEEYVAYDGRRFRTYDECASYEYKLVNEYMRDYLYRNALGIWNEDYSGIGGYLGQGGNTTYLVVVDQKIIEWSEKVEFPEDLAEREGQAIFIATDGWFWGNDWEYLVTLDEVLRWMERDRRWLVDRKAQIRKEKSNGDSDTEE